MPQSRSDATWRGSFASGYGVIGEPLLRRELSPPRITTMGRATFVSDPRRIKPSRRRFAMRRIITESSVGARLRASAQTAIAIVRSTRKGSAGSQIRHRDADSPIVRRDWWLKSAPWRRCPAVARASFVLASEGAGGAQRDGVGTDRRFGRTVCRSGRSRNGWGSIGGRCRGCVRRASSRGISARRRARSSIASTICGAS